MARYSCSDRLCGALDCQTCYPGNRYNEEIEEEDKAYWNHIGNLEAEMRGN